MTSAGSVHFTAYQAEYEAVLARARHVVACYPPLLRDLAEPLHPQWGEAPFSLIVALLPYWVADLLDQALPLEGSARLSRPEETKTLALANLLGWWSYLIQDGLLDRELERPELLPLATALHAAAVRLLARLLPGDQVFWDAFEALSLTAAEAHCWEQGSRPGLAVAGFDDLDRLADRSALLQLAVVAQLRLRGYDQEHPLGRALTEMLRHYAIARQIGDDLGDWVDDLQGGRLNYVSARIVQRMVETGAVENGAELDVERMAGYFLYDDELLAGIQQVAMAACHRARRCITPYGSRYLEALVDELAGRLERSYEAVVEGRRRLRGGLAPLDPTGRQMRKP